MANRRLFHVGAVAQVDDDVFIPDDESVTGSLFYLADQVALVATPKTLAIGDSGILQRVTASTTITLPATVVGYTYIIENGGPDGTVTINISPNASDKIAGNGFTAADDKDMINTLGNKGDRVVLVGDGVNGWFCQMVRGLWTREA